MSSESHKLWLKVRGKNKDSGTCCPMKNNKMTWLLCLKEQTLMLILLLKEINLHLFIVVFVHFKQRFKITFFQFNSFNEEFYKEQKHFKFGTMSTLIQWWTDWIFVGRGQRAGLHWLHVYPELFLVKIKVVETLTHPVLSSSCLSLEVISSNLAQIVTWSQDELIRFLVVSLGRYACLLRPWLVEANNHTAAIEVLKLKENTDYILLHPVSYGLWTVYDFSPGWVGGKTKQRN